MTQPDRGPTSTQSPTPSPTPGQTVGPFFHYALPFPGDHQLVPAAVGHTTRLHGVVYDGRGAPVPDALVELRQADQWGRVPACEGSLHRDAGVFTGWGRCATDAVGRYSFTTLEPAATANASASFFSLVVLARGLLDRLFTRVYLPEVETARVPLLSVLPTDRASTLVAARDEDGGLRFDIHLQGDRETVFLTFPGHGAP